LEKQLNSKHFAAFVVEPIQSEAGIKIPPQGYLKEAEAICRRTGTLFVLDEVQTGMFRTGPFLAGHHYGVRADMVVLAKALSGGLAPVGATLMTDAVYERVYSSLRRAIIHTSTFSENSFSMRAGLATLDVLERESLGARAAELGEELRQKLREELEPFEMVKEVRGLGMLSGIEFGTASKLALKVAFEVFMKIHPAMFGQIVVGRMFRDKNILTQICGNNFMVLKVAPPLVVEDAQMDAFVSAIREVVELANSPGAFWSEAIGLARRAFRSS
jgi:ornithine--oxo-acid transaminase